MEQINFHDMPGRISIENAVVRLDLYDRPLLPQENGPDYVFGERVVLPIPAFVKLYQMMGEVVLKLEAEGVVHRTPASTGGQEARQP